MKSFCVTLLFFLITGNILRGQIFNPYQEIFGEYPFFNEKFIARNHIPSLKASVMYKKRNDLIRTSQEEEAYFFDSNGKMVRRYWLVNNGHSFDTLQYYYYYAHDTLSAITYTYDGGYHRKDFFYDSKHRLIKIQYSRIENKYPNLSMLLEGTSTFLAEETYEYVYADSLFQKRIIKNSYLRPFKEEIFEYDKNGFLMRKEEIFLIGGQRTETFYKYDKNGWIQEKKVQQRNESSDIRTEVWNYHYDNIGNIQKIEYSLNGTLMTLTEFLYNKDTYCIKAVISKRVEDEFLTIRKFE